MIYGPDLTKRISDELQKIPNIRNVCSKFGIDHSTFYRWMGSYPTFRKEVRAALYFGREHMNNIAETVIIKGVQNGEYRSATFWLVHNDRRYMQRDKGEYYADLLEMDKNFIRKEIPKDDINFEQMFKVLQEWEADFPLEDVWCMLKSTIDLFCRHDKDLPDLLKASYVEWKDDKKKIDDLIKRVEPLYKDYKEEE